MNTNDIKGCGSSAILIMWNEAQKTIFDLRWMIVLSVILIVVDFYYGTRESRRHYEEAKIENNKAGMEKYRFHFSRAGRRSFNKFVDYITYLLVSCLIGIAITEPLCGISHVITSAVGLGAGCLFDVCSTVGHILVLHNLETPRLSTKGVTRFALKYAANFVKRKDADAGEALDETIDNNLNLNNDDKRTKKQ